MFDTPPSSVDATDRPDAHALELSQKNMACVDLASRLTAGTDPRRIRYTCAVGSCWTARVLPCGFRPNH